MNINIRIYHYKFVSYKKLEHDVDTNLTDKDMLKLHIDFALENGDKETFMKLSQELKEMTQ